MTMKSRFDLLGFDRDGTLAPGLLEFGPLAYVASVAHLPEWPGHSRSQHESPRQAGTTTP